MRGEASSWSDKCINVVANLRMNLLAATIQPLPRLASIDLAAAFFSAEKWKEEQVFFGKWCHATDL